MNKPHSTKLDREMGLLALTATGVCSMLGASIYVVPFMIQRHVPGIGPYVLLALALAAIPAFFAALAYSNLGSAMPRAGGSYIYASRGLSPFLGFIASFSQWFGLSIVIGVIAYIIVPFFRDITTALEWNVFSEALEIGWIRVLVSLLLVWTFVAINIRGLRSYQRALLPMMYVMFVLGAIVVIAGFTFNTSQYLEAVYEKEGRNFIEILNADFDWRILFSAAAILFSSFIGFDSIAQAGGEAKNAGRNIPRAILLAILSVGIFYFFFTAAVYHTIPWSFVAAEAMEKDITAPGLLGYVLPPGLGVAILLGAAIALINDLPAMLLSVSRLMFAWAKDGIFPKFMASVHPVRHSPHVALVAAGIMASVGVLGSHFAGDFFLGIDIMVTSMMVNFLLMCITLLTISTVNPTLAQKATVLKNQGIRKLVGWFGVLFLIVFLTIHTYKDLTSEVEAWYFHSTLIWLLVMTLASLIFAFKWRRLRSQGINLERHFAELPEE